MRAARAITFGSAVADQRVIELHARTLEAQRASHLGTRTKRVRRALEARIEGGAQRALETKI